MARRRRAGGTAAEVQDVEALKVVNIAILKGLQPIRKQMTALLMLNLKKLKKTKSNWRYL